MSRKDIEEYKIKIVHLEHVLQRTTHEKQVIYRHHFYFYFPSAVRIKIQLFYWTKVDGFQVSFWQIVIEMKSKSFNLIRSWFQSG